MKPPVGVPPTVVHGGKKYQYDCISGSGDAVFFRVQGKDGDQRFHVLLIRETA